MVTDKAKLSKAAIYLKDIKYAKLLNSEIDARQHHRKLSKHNVDEFMSVHQKHKKRKKKVGKQCQLKKSMPTVKNEAKIENVATVKQYDKSFTTPFQQKINHTRSIKHKTIQEKFHQRKKVEVAIDTKLSNKETST